MSVCALPFMMLAVMCWLSPFVPMFAGEQLGVLEAAVYGTIIFAAGFGIRWQAGRCVIRADVEGITQNNGFRCQSVRWEEVAAYYMEPNPKYCTEQPFIEPILLNASGEVILRPSAHGFSASPAINVQRRELWRFVEAQLEGKKADAPFVDFAPEALARRSLAVDWKTKSVAWKIARIFGLVFYAVFWFAVFWSPVYYLVSHNIALPKFAALIVPPALFFGPLLPWWVWLQIKKRKIAREWETRDEIES